MTALFGKKATAPEPAPGVAVTFTLNAKLQPMHRGEFFEDALDDALGEAGLGEVDGGGTGMGAEGEIDFCDMVVIITAPLEEALPRVVAFLEEYDAPRGSHYQVDGTDEKVPFGKAEGLGLYLNGTDLPDEVYAGNDINDLIELLDDAVEGIGTRMSHWEGPRETALYFYGASFADMADAVAGVVEKAPLAERSRVVQIA